MWFTKPTFVGVLVLQIAAIVSANTEKVIFLGPQSVQLPQDGPSFATLGLNRLSPKFANYRSALPVTFPNSSHPRGLQSWYLLHDLSPGARYEVRICWAATQPTNWILEVFNVTETMEIPELIQGLALYTEQRTASITSDDQGVSNDQFKSPQSLLFLRVHGAADYFSLDEGLMQRPESVKVDLILDSFLLNILPRSLLPTAIYVCAIAIFGLFASNLVWIWLVGTHGTHKERIE
ncbi:hypothetical protein CAC42_7960 [Sphaceloma murrayae]|uniref:Uncharacterized protein n=1 Tax=Sphaceloma murrayae TaxID=2082308 RepID=A0A2K1QYL3_9PEZI|nr:hypothetical protein CAC42_7960 [Sphaceloma murrayae]